MTGDEMTDDKVQVTKLNNNIILKRDKNSNFFLSSGNSFIISLPNFATLLKFMLEKGIISVKVLEGVIIEYYSNRPD